MMTAVADARTSACSPWLAPLSWAGLLGNAHTGHSPPRAARRRVLWDLASPAVLACEPRALPASGRGPGLRWLATGHTESWVSMLPVCPRLARVLRAHLCGKSRSPSFALAREKHTSCLGCPEYFGDAKNGSPRKMKETHRGT